jgi:hypothetical protein
MQEQCWQVKPRANAVTMLSGLQPGAGVVWEEQGKKFTATADVSGDIMLSSTVAGRICRVDGKR